MRVALAAVIAAAALAVAGCGSDGGDGGDGGGAGGGSSLGARSADEILQQAADAMGKVRSYHVEASQRDKDGPLELSGDISANGPSQLRFEQGDQRFQVRLVGGATYMKADAAFWRNQGGGNGEVLERLADRWVKAPGDGFGLRRAIEQLSPSTLAHCLTRDHGKITKKGSGEVDGQATVVLHDDGKTPGGTPGDLHIAATGRPLPLRVVQTGPETPGRPSDSRCGDEQGQTLDSDVRLSAFDRPLDIRAPKDALDLSTLGQEQREGRVS